MKVKVATETLASELSRLCRAIVRVTGTDDPALPTAIAEVVSRVGVYRTDYRVLSAVLPEAISEPPAQHRNWHLLYSWLPRHRSSPSLPRGCSSCAAR